VSGYRAARQRALWRADFRVPGKRRIRDARGRRAERLARRARRGAGKSALHQARRRRRDPHLLRRESGRLAQTTRLSELKARRKPTRRRLAPGRGLSPSVRMQHSIKKFFTTSLTTSLSSAPVRGLVLCAVGGAVCSTLHTPLPWMIGPLLAMALAKLFAVDVGAPRGGRESGQLLIGCTLGLYFTPVVAIALQSYAFVMLLAAVLAIVLGYVCAFVLAKISHVDRTTAFFACVAGGASEMALLAERYGAAMDKVAF